MNEKNTYTGSKVKNSFTAYLLGFIRGRRRAYLEKMTRIESLESELLENYPWEDGLSMESHLERSEKERLLLKEADGVYPEWNEMIDHRLVEALLTLREEERKMIYQHVFEEKTFDEMSLLNGLPSDRVKGIYYYAIRKIRVLMGGDRYDI